MNVVVVVMVMVMMMMNVVVMMVVVVMVMIVIMIQDDDREDWSFTALNRKHFQKIFLSPGPGVLDTLTAIKRYTRVIILFIKQTRVFYWEINRA